MEYISSVQIKTNLEFLEEVTEFQMTQGINEHVCLHLAGMVKEESGDGYLKQQLVDEPVEVWIEGQGGRLFQGLIQQIEVQYSQQVYYVELEAASYSIQMDLKKQRRSYQDRERLYYEVAEELVRRYPGGDLADRAFYKEKTGRFLLQYEETDWRFLKRLASHFHAGILPSPLFAAPKVTIGVPDGDDVGEVGEYNYKISKDLEYYKRGTAQQNPPMMQLDSVCFQIETGRSFEIGDRVLYQNARLYIRRKETKMVDARLKFYYELTSRGGMLQKKFCNKQIIGLSLKGRVVGRVEDRIRVGLGIEEKPEGECLWEFPYMTSYAAGSQTGWYCMPEVGDTVFLYFPTKEEGRAVGLNSIREKRRKGDKVENPTIKYFRTKDGKEIKFSRDEVQITCTNGADPESGSVTLTLNQDTGVQLVSTGPVTIQTEKGLRLEAEGAIRILAGDEVRLKCKTSEVRMAETIDLCGSEVRMN